MTTYVWRGGKLVEKHLAGPRHEGGVAPYVISDIMSEAQHMASGRFHTSKSEFRKDTKAAGCIELGNDPALYRSRKPVQLDRGQRREAIRQALYEARNK